MNKVAIAGYGNTKFTRDDTPIESLLLSATKSLFDQNTNLNQKDIDAVIVSTNDNSKYLSAILSELAGIDLPIIQFNPIGDVAESFQLMTSTLFGDKI